MRSISLLITDEASAVNIHVDIISITGTVMSLPPLTHTVIWSVTANHFNSVIVLITFVQNVLNFLKLYFF